jgi:hypothetical protein
MIHLCVNQDISELGATTAPALGHKATPLPVLQKIRTTKEIRPKRLRKFDPREPLGRDGNQKGFSLPLDYPCVKDRRKE